MARENLELILSLKDRASGALQRFQRGLRGVQRQSRLTDISVGGLAARLAGIVAAFQGLRSIISTGAEFESLRTSLEVVTGSAQEAAQAFSFIQGVAKQLPGTVQETTKAFIRMTALGITPTEERLISFTNTASVMNKGLIDFVEAVADAAQGEFERLKEFGIKSRVEGDKVAFTFKNRTVEIENNATSIAQFLETIGNTEFAGAATEQMDTLSGRFSNLKDAVARLSDRLINGFVGDAIKRVIRGLTIMVGAVSDNFSDIQHFGVSLVDGLIRQWKSFEQDFKIATEAIGFAFTKVVNAMEDLWIGTVNKLISGYNKLVSFIPGLSKVEEVSARAGRDTRTWAERIKELELNYKDELEVHQNVIDLWHADIELEKAAARGTEDYNKKLNERKDAETKLQVAISKKNKATKEELTVFQKLSKEIEENRIKVDQSWQAQEMLDQAFQDGKISADEYANALKQVNSNLGVEQVKNTQEEFSVLRENVKEAARSMQSSMSDFFFDAMDGRLSDLGKSFRNTINRMMADLAASGLFDFLLGDFGATGRVGGFFGRLFQGTFAEGGQIKGGIAGLVGERGPELFIPDRPGQIIPTEQVQDIATSMAPTLNFNINAIDGNDLMNTLETNKEEIAKLVRGAETAFNIRN